MVPERERQGETVAHLPGIADRIRMTRESRGLTQSALAARLGVARSQITLWETGGRNPSPTSVTQLALALGIDVEWLATGQGLPKPPLAMIGGVDPQLFELVVEAVHEAFKRRKLDVASKRFTQVVVVVYATAAVLWTANAHQDATQFREHLLSAAVLALGA